jgi:2-dehydro-3-deoxygalactonokinase
MTKLRYDDWIAIDWGTTHLRAWGLSATGEVLVHGESDAGMGGLKPDGFEPALLRLVGAWLPMGGTVQAVACGMVGSRQGWIEAPYRAVPTAPLAAGGLARPAMSDARLLVHVVPGLKQENPADVMRGEETQIAGVLATHADFDGVLCLPGTHTKWVHISAGEIVSFQTFMTGELFSLLSEQSVLRHSLAGGGWNDAAFAEGIDAALSRPERIAARLFSLRAEALLTGLSPDRARARLSGLLIGAELAAARPYWLGRAVGIVGASGVGGAYAQALATQGLTATQLDAEAMTLAGLAAAYRGLTEHTT